MDQLQTSRAGWRRLTPRAGVRPQLVAAAVLWGVGTSVLLIRGVFYIVSRDEVDRFGYWVALIGLAAVAIGLVKARLILIRYAKKAVRRIKTRGHACFFGFFAPTSPFCQSDGNPHISMPGPASRGSSLVSQMVS